MKPEKVIIQYSKKTITKQQLGELLGKTSDDELYQEVTRLEEAGMLSAVRSSRTNGNRNFPLYLKYKITIAESAPELTEEIGALHPLLLASGYLQKNPKEYAQYRNTICKLDKFMFSKGALSVPVSRKERSFEIFGEEKQLDDRSFCAVLSKLGVTKEKLSYYDTPEYCFHDYLPERKAEMTLLICENKDIWFNIRRRMFEDGASKIFEIPIDGVLYGEGNKIAGNGALTAYTSFLRCAQVHYLYWGDIDCAGLNIYISLKRLNPALDIALFVPAYEEMLLLAQGKTMPDSEDHRGRIGDYAEILNGLAPAYRSDMQKSLEDNKRLPQEIVTYAYLQKIMR